MCQNGTVRTVDDSCQFIRECSVLAGDKSYFVITFNFQVMDNSTLDNMLVCFGGHTPCNNYDLVVITENEIIINVLQCSGKYLPILASQIPAHGFIGENGLLLNFVIFNLVCTRQVLICTRRILPLTHVP